MRILSIDLTNWMNISKASLTFSEGINVLYGQNGQGKSAVLDAIAFCLIDRKRGDSFKDYIKIGEKFFEIKLRVQLGDEDSSIATFTYSGGSSTCQKDIEYQGEHFVNSDTANFLTKHFDQTMLQNVIFLLQDSSPITTMTPAERRDIFKKIFNSDYTSIVDRVKIDQKAVEQKIIAFTTEKELLSAKKYPLFRILDVDMDALVRLQKELEDSRNSALDKEKFKAYSDKLKDANTRREELAKAIKVKEITQKTITDENASITSLRGIIETNEKTIEGYVESVITLGKDIATKRGELEAEKAKGTSDLDTELANLNAKLIEEKSTLAMNQRYHETHKKGKCDQCGHDCSIADLAKYERLVDAGKIQVDYLSGCISEVNKKIKEAKDRIASMETALRAVEKEETTAKATLASLRATVESKNNEIKLHEKRVIEAQAKLVTDDEGISRLSTILSELDEWLSNNKVEVKEDSATRPSADIQREIDEITTQIQENAAHEKINAQSQIDRQKDTQRIAEITDEANKLQIEVKNLAAVVSVFTTDFPSFINMKACQVLEGYMNDFFANTKDGFKISLQQDKKGINFFYKAAAEPEWNSIKMLSGFETALTTLCFKVAVAYAYGASFIVLDEPDGAADPKSSARLFETISNIGGFKQMFVITHKESAIELLKDNGAQIYEVYKGTFTRVAA